MNLTTYDRKQLLKARRLLAFSGQQVALVLAADRSISENGLRSYAAVVNSMKAAELCLQELVALPTEESSREEA